LPDPLQQITLLPIELDARHFAGHKRNYLQVYCFTPQPGICGLYRRLQEDARPELDSMDG
jgi:hypothetical protein